MGRAELLDFRNLLITYWFHRIRQEIFHFFLPMGYKPENYSKLNKKSITIPFLFYFSSRYQWIHDQFLLILEVLAGSWFLVSRSYLSVLLSFTIYTIQFLLPLSLSLDLPFINQFLLHNLVDKILDWKYNDS